MPTDKPPTSIKPEKPNDKGFHIRIDRTEYVVKAEKLSGADLRKLPEPPISEDRDLYQIIAGQDDVKIKDDDPVRMEDGLRFFTTPSTINPGFTCVESDIKFNQ